MKLNKKGWTLSSELFYMIIFFLCLIVAIIGVIKFNLLLDQDNLLYNENAYYETLEDSLVDASKNYISDINKINTSIVLTSDRLINTGYLPSLNDENGNACTGYVIIKYNDNFKYNSYIKCPEYMTNGYQE